ncbi:MAG: ABC transporter ATP-binding protein [Coriobacteriia bacterium]
MTHAIRDVTASFGPGIHVITGRSGSGKTTLLNLLAGLETPSSGEVRYRDTQLSGLDDEALSAIRARQFGFVFQDYKLVSELNVEQNIALPLFLQGKGDVHRLVKSVASDLGVGDKLSSLPAELSGGQQQRVAIARALVHNPDVIFADEPTGNLDEETSHEVAEVLLKLAVNSERTLILVTHDRDWCAQADHTYLMTDGQLRVL